MHFGQTIGLLVALTVAILILRFFWARMPKGAERAVLFFACLVVALRFVFLVTLSRLLWPFFDALLCWAAVVGYELMLVRFSLMQPRWLTSISAFVLLLPIFGSTLLFPLTGIFNTEPSDIHPIGGHYLLERSPWDVDVGGHEGIDLGIFYRPPWAPFLRRMVQRGSFSEEQCDTKAVTVSVDPANKLVRFHCPGHHEGQNATDLTLPLR
jgi:hypothetical protein